MSLLVVRSPRTTIRVAVLVVVGWTGGSLIPSAHGQGVKSDPPALFLAVGVKYEDSGLGDMKLADLKRTWPSAEKLATECLKYGYRVTVATDGDTAETVRKKVPGATVAVMTDGESLKNEIAAWRERSFDKGQAAFGLLVFTGHGEVREKDDGMVQYFLTPKSRSGNGGLDVRDLQRKLGKARLPVALVLDVCRTKASVRFAELIAGPLNLDRLPSLRTRFTPIADGPEVYPLTLWSVRDGQAAEDREFDLVAALAEGLGVNDQGRFVARSGRFPRLDPFPGATVADNNTLSLSAWLLYASTAVRAAPGERHETELDHRYGPLDENAVVAVLRNGRPAAVTTATPSDDLLALWDVASGTGGAFARTTVPAGTRITRPAGPIAKPWAYGQLARELAYDQRTVVAELVADAPAGSPPLTIQLHAGFKPKVGDDVFLNRGNSQATRIKIPLHRPTIVAVPLDRQGRDQKLNQLSVAVAEGTLDKDWPAEGTLTVTRLKLVSDEQAGHLKARAEVPVRLKGLNLLSRWWPLDEVMRTSESSATVKYAITNSRGHLTLAGPGGVGPAEVGRGGPISPPVYVRPTGYALRVQLVSATDGQPTEAVGLTVRCFAGDKLVASGEVSYDPKGKSAGGVVEFTQTGWVDYLTLVTTSSKVHVGSLELVEK